VVGSVAYLDTSALVKLVVVEPESSALRNALARWPTFASAALIRTETVRALRRSGNGQYAGTALRLLRTVHLVRVNEALLDRAAYLDPPDLRSLDALHLAAALELSSDLGALYTYDARLTDAAEAYGLDVRAPR
jgi:uncharacterized protein